MIVQIEEGCMLTSLFLDFSTAFDSLNHNHLLQKLTTIDKEATDNVGSGAV